MEKKNIVNYRNCDGDIWQARTSRNMKDAVRLGYIYAERASHHSSTRGWSYDGAVTPVEIPLHSIYEIKLG